jgi:hypothetical protein
MSILPKQIFHRLIPSLVLLCVIPAVLLLIDNALTIYRSMDPSYRLVLSILGILLITVGLTLLFVTAHLFVQRVEGAIMPWDPNKKIRGWRILSVY